MQNTYNITAHNLFDFLKEVQYAVQQGYVLSDLNINFPQAYISLYTVTLVKEEPVAEVDTIVADVTIEVPVTITDIPAKEVKKSTGRPKGSK